MFELGDKVTIDTEGYCGPAYIRSFERDGAFVSIERFGARQFFVLIRNMKAA